jgi:hypothetical protein
MTRDNGRRRFLKRGVALGAALATVGRAAAGHGQPSPDDPSKVLGLPKRSYGERSRFEGAERKLAGKTDEHGRGWTPLHESLGISHRLRSISK